MFGLNAAREPDAEAHVDILLSEYRKIDPGYWEEIIFYDHPSGRRRVHMAMQWKAENTAPNLSKREEQTAPIKCN
jgi:STE24 endopeptidase